MSLLAPQSNEQVRLSRQGDPHALADLRAQCHAPLFNILLARGASPTEAEDVLADLWADCVPGGDDRPSVLEKFSGRCSFQGWLATVATHRWIDWKRRQARHIGPGSDALDGPLARLPAGPAGSREDALVGLLRDSLLAALAASSPEAMVLLRLVYVHGITQRELMKMLGWSESKVIVRFWIAALVFALFALTTLKLR